MTVLDLHEHGGFLALDEAQCRAAGRALKPQYTKASPFPHIVMDDFIDHEVLSRVVQEFPHSAATQSFNRSQERLKYQFGPKDWNGTTTHNVFALFNTAAFVSFLEAMTGIDGLIPDPWFKGGGLHETKAGGHLGIHADFNLHQKLGLIRRLNLLIYLNEDWLPEYGGNLELWDRTMTTREVAVAPDMGRAVIFTTDLDSYHGHPDPLTCPADRSRRSMAFYYYTAPAEGLANVPWRTTQFQVRPETSDSADWKIKAFHMANDWVPLAVRRRLPKPKEK